MTLLPNKTVRHEIIADSSRAISFARGLFRLIQNERETVETIKELKAEIALLKQQVHDLQIREDVLIAKAQLEASRAAAQVVADLSRRLGQIEPKN